MLLSVNTRETFIPDNHRQVNDFTEFLGESGDLLSLCTKRAVHVQWLSHDDLMHVIFLCQTPDELQVGFEAFSPDGRADLRGQKQLVADRDTDGFISDIEA